MVCDFRFIINHCFSVAYPHLFFLVLTLFLFLFFFEGGLGVLVHSLDNPQACVALWGYNKEIIGVRDTERKKIKG